MVQDDFVELKGKEPGPVSVILAGVHGDEVCGLRALEQVLPNLSIERGTLFIGYGNPAAIRVNRRFTEANLNRLFKPGDELSRADKASYEYGRMLVVKRYLDMSGALLDIHASFTPGGRPFVICENNGLSIADRLPFDLVVGGFDKVEPGGTDYYMNRIGKIGICAECGYLEDPASTERAVKSIFSFLYARGHVSGKTDARSQERLVMYYLHRTRTDRFRLARRFNDFDGLARGEIIGMDGAEAVSSPKESVILFARDCDGIGEEAFLLGSREN